MSQRFVAFNVIGGNLIVTLTPQGRELIKQSQANDVNTDSDSFMADLFEWHTCNGWEWIGPVEIAALTSAPILSNDIERDDEGRLVGVGTVYWFPNYQIESPVQTLYDTGTVTFTGVPPEGP